MGLDSAQIHAAVQAKFPQAIVEDQVAAVDPFLVIRPEELESVAFFCRDDESLQLDMLSCITGVDYPERQAIEVIYSLDSTTQHHRLTIKVQLPRDNPTVSTVESVWRTADWHERETYDLLGVDFAGHHNLIRILCAEDWEGHPLRKDYVMPESYHGIKNVVY
jgi:NADH-quinone oxidoreductase subunit C